MNRSAIILALLLGACGQSETGVYVPADMLQPAPGWTGPVPSTEGQLIDAAAAEMRGRQQANAQLEAIAQIVSQ